MKNDFMSEIRESKAKIDKQYEETKNIEKKLRKFHAEADVFYPLGIDEAAVAYITSMLAVMRQEYGSNFRGYKVGRILAYILDVLNEKIEESMTATTRVSVPLYEQCMIINSNDFKVATVEELLEESKRILEIVAEKLKKRL